jgi:very-short-patch-repair endonuclease
MSDLPPPLAPGDDRSRILHLLDFLAAYDSRKNPPVRDIADYGLFLLREPALLKSESVRLTPGADIWLTVDFVELPNRPEVPSDIAELLHDGASISAHRHPNLRADLEPSDVQRANRWIEQAWTPWSRRHNELTAVKALYRDLFDTRQRLQLDRESVELIWGFGRLQWTPENETRIDHPFLSIEVEIDVDATSQQLTVRPSGAIEVETLYLADVNVADRVGLNVSRQTVAELDEPIDVWDSATAESWYRRLARAIDHRATLHQNSDSNAAVATMDWALHLRRRRPNYQGFLDDMRDLYEDGAMIPHPLTAVVIDEPSRLLDENDDLGSSTASREPLLLPLPTNEEQQRILRLAQRRPGVTVQGPPGTGKSHTIANIVSHYVAYGKRVLVVAEKEQALRVLADKIPEGIRDLTVSVLGADEDGRRRLGSSITQIQTRVTGIDRAHADREIDRLTALLDDIDRRIARATAELLGTRRTEADPMPGTWECGVDPTPAVAADWVASNAEQLDYINDPLTPSTRVPITPGELAELIALVQELTPAEADAALKHLPATSSLPETQALTATFEELASLDGHLATVDDKINSWEAVDAHADQLVMLWQQVDDHREWMMKTSGSWQGRLRQVVSDPLVGGEWANFAVAVRADREKVFELRRELAAHTVSVPDNPEPQFEQDLADALTRLTTNGKLGVFASKQKRALELCRIDDRVPSTSEDVQHCIWLVEANKLRRQLSTRWNTQISRVDGITVDSQSPEDAVGAPLDDVEAAIGWRSEWLRLATELRKVVNSVPDDPEPGQLETLRDTLETCRRRQRQRQLTAELHGLRAMLQTGATVPDASPTWTTLVGAVDRRDTKVWDEQRQHVGHLHAIAPRARRLIELRDRLAVAAPAWTSAIVSTRGTAGRNADDLQRAWQWRQLETWVRAVSSAGNPAKLQRDLEQFSIDRRRAVADLVAERAWRRLADNLTDRHRQALNSYVKAVNRYGKTGGKFAARWLAEIRAALNESKEAVPVWIMTTSRALTSFRPEAVPPFDVLVIDEASQIGIDAAPLFSLARSTIVVGDDKQTSPDNVGMNRQVVFNMLDEHVSMIPNYRTLLDPDNSLYDLAFQKFPDVVMLTEHFRCLPDIIQFSNIHAYDGAIIPLRDQPPHPGWAAVGAVKVLDGYRRGDVNEPEADAVVDLIAEMCDNSDYDGMDFGVVSLLGSSQSKLIWDKLFDQLGPETMTERRIRCGEPANFQGDERDVIVLSTVVATDPSNPTGRIGAMTGLPAKRRINVAASRARQQMWVVHSVEPDRFPRDDLRAELIKHCTHPMRLGRDLGALEEKCESDFERQIVRRILKRGFTQVKVQHPVGRFRLDIVVEGPDARLAVEADGDRWHGEDVWHQDRARQEVLERAGWTFVRIRGSAFYRDPNTALEPLWDRLDELGIPTGDEWVKTSTTATVRVVGDADATHHDAGSEASPELPTEQPSDTTWDAPPAPATRPAPAPAPLRGPTREPNRPATFRPPTAGSTTAAVASQDRPGANLISSQGSAEMPLPFSASDTVRPSDRNGRLQPYITWPSRPLRDVATASEQHLIDGLVDIVSGEGPMHALFAYQLYVKAAGGQRVGKEIRKVLNKAANAAIRSGAIAQVHDQIPGQIEKTLYIPGTPPVIVRGLGPRLLFDVPRSELRTLANSLGVNAADRTTAMRTILDELNLTRLTERTATHLDEVLRYEWTI